MLSEGLQMRMVRMSHTIENVRQGHTMQTYSSLSDITGYKPCVMISLFNTRLPILVTSITSAVTSEVYKMRLLSNIDRSDFTLYICQR